MKKNEKLEIFFLGITKIFFKKYCSKNFDVKKNFSEKFFKKIWKNLIKNYELLKSFFDEKNFNFLCIFF